MNRYFELIDNSQNHYKFWQIITEGGVVNVRFGRIGTQGQTQVKTFPSTSAAEAHAYKLIKEKTGKGYMEKDRSATGPVHKPLPIAAPPPPKPAPVVPVPVQKVPVSKADRHRRVITRRRQVAEEDDEKE